MQNKLFFSVIVLFFIGVAVPEANSALSNVILQPDDGKDAYIQGSDQSDYQAQYNNYGDEPTLVSSKSANPNGGLIEFNLSDQSSDIQSASLSVYLVSNANDTTTIGVYQILESWDEGTVTWANQPEVNPVAVDLNILSGDDGNNFITFDITSLVKSWLNSDEINYGVYIGFFDDSGTPQIPNAHIYSSDFNNSSDAYLYDPKLDIVINSSQVPVPGAGFLLAGGLFFLIAYQRKTDPR
nr:DNRLRE domain-containing protein [uncultured Desulfobacter sp.]